VSVGQQEQRAAADPRPQGKSFTFTFLGVHPKKTFVTFLGGETGVNFGVDGARSWKINAYKLLDARLTLIYSTGIYVRHIYL